MGTSDLRGSAPEAYPNQVHFSYFLCQVLLFLEPSIAQVTRRNDFV